MYSDHLTRHSATIIDCRKPTSIDHIRGDIMLKQIARAVRNRTSTSRPRRRPSRGYGTENLEPRILLTDLITPTGSPVWLDDSQIWLQVTPDQISGLFSTVNETAAQLDFDAFLENNPIGVAMTTNTTAFPDPSVLGGSTLVLTVDPSGNLALVGGTSSIDFDPLTDPLVDAAVSGSVVWFEDTFPGAVDTGLQALNEHVPELIVAGLTIGGALIVESVEGPGLLSDSAAVVDQTLQDVLGTGIPNIDLPGITLSDNSLGTLTLETEIIFLSESQVLAMGGTLVLVTPVGGTITTTITPTGSPTSENLNLTVAGQTEIQINMESTLTLGAGTTVLIQNGSVPDPVVLIGAGVTLNETASLQVVHLIHTGSAPNETIIGIVVKPKRPPWNLPW